LPQRPPRAPPPPRPPPPPHPPKTRRPPIGSPVQLRIRQLLTFIVQGHRLRRPLYLLLKQLVHASPGNFRFRIIPLMHNLLPLLIRQDGQAIHHLLVPSNHAFEQPGEVAHITLHRPSLKQRRRILHSPLDPLPRFL